MTIEEYLLAAIKNEASDLHLANGKPPVLRIDGQLRVLKADALRGDEIQKMVYSMLTNDQIQRLEETKELDLSYGIAEGRFRVNVHWERGSLGASFRTIAAKIPTLEQLEMPKVAYDLARLHKGLVLVTGPTGSGKSTALASMIDLINTERNCHIVTFEDPIEFLHLHKRSVVKQREVGMDTLSFANALRHVLRQDPDVILVGEMRDLETIAAAVTLAETGHLVFATLHTQDAAQTVDRIIDVFPPHQQAQIRMQLSVSLQGVVSQILLNRAGGGRVAAREIMIITPAIANLIREGKTHQIYSAIQTGAAKGMITMDQALNNLCQKGLISRETALTYASNPGEIR
ncbi:MAG: type IV pili twitching motility protein PilT [Armatimonadetes bacterium CG07_land_8_20_14_0_80_40_9]|nr:MAG: type IV pili twitching motility protein PilT [Armatimonadetes bacterium CG07_land_8_20_14_0_80_40_9]